MKWIPVVIGIALAVAFVAWQRDTVKTSYVNGLETYSKLPGGEYLLQRECYIFSDKSLRRDFPLIADSRLVPALPPKVDAAMVGTEIGSIKLLDIAPVGSRLRLVSVRRDESRKGTTISFELLFMDDDARKYPRIDAFFVLDHGPEAQGRPPVFLPDYFVPRVRL